MSDGEYRLGELDVTVSAGVARLADPGPAASAPSRARPPRWNWWCAARSRRSACPSPTSPPRPSTTPARRLGLDRVTGSLRAGLAADVVLLDEDFRLDAVIARGERHHPVR